jgi:hypothetical protein
MHLKPQKLKKLARFIAKTLKNVLLQNGVVRWCAKVLVNFSLELCSSCVRAPGMFFSLGTKVRSAFSRNVTNKSSRMATTLD